MYLFYEKLNCAHIISWDILPSIDIERINNPTRHNAQFACPQYTHRSVQYFAMLSFSIVLFTLNLKKGQMLGESLAAFPII